MNRRSPLSPDLRRFILACIPSVPYLEAALLLRADAGRTWQPAEVSKRLYVDERQGDDILQQLATFGIARCEYSGGWVYAPEPSLAELLDQLAAAYSADLVSVTVLIHSRFDRRAQQFADAFRFRKD